MTGSRKRIADTPPRVMFNGMSTVAEIVEAVRTLPLEDLRAVRALIEELEAARFDSALADGAAAGVFDDLLSKADAAHRTGKTVPLHDILRDA